MNALIKPGPITGFPEFLPEIRYTEQQMLDTVRHIFEKYGFVSVETPVVEKLEILLSKGADTDKEMYTLTRLHADSADSAKMGLHYDLTVPFARYVAQHENELTFPFKRYQMQHCWRGERPQAGRYRQFLQCDIDVINRNSVSLEYDALIPAIISEALNAIGVQDFCLNMSNRKILQGFLEGVQVPNLAKVVHWLDKIKKVGTAVLAEELSALGLTALQIEKCIALMDIVDDGTHFVEKIKALSVENETLNQGLTELEFCVNRFKQYSSVPVFVNLSIIRGFDYYTGTVYEIEWRAHPDIGSIAGGGRYENLTGTMTKTKLPGVGMGFGFSRVFGALLKANELKTNGKTATQVLVVHVEKEEKDKMIQVAKALQARGIAAEMYLESDKLGKQLKYANDKGIPYVWFDVDNVVRDMKTGDQKNADLLTWVPE